MVAVYGAGCAITSALPVRLPGSIVDMVLLLVLLVTGLLKAQHVDNACDCLLDNMSLFFIPAGVAIMGCVPLLESNALKLALVCVVTTVIVFLATAYTVMLVSRLTAKRADTTGNAPSRTRSRRGASSFLRLASITRTRGAKASAVTARSYRSRGHRPW